MTTSDVRCRAGASPALDAPRARYAKGCRALAAMYQARLSRIVHTVLDDYGLGSG